MPHDEHSDNERVATPPDSVPADRPRVRLGPNPQDFAHAVPLLLGFHPSASLVTIFLRERVVIATARIDLPPPGSARSVWPVLAAALAGSRADAVVLIAYAGPDIDAFLSECILLCPIPVMAALRVHEGRLWVLTCANGPACCPPGALLDPAYSSVLEPMMIHAGVAVASSRQDLAACLAPASDDVLARVSAHLNILNHQTPAAHMSPLDRYGELEAARAERLNGPVALSEVQAARLLYCLGDRDVMDTCCSWGNPGWLLFLALIRLTPRSHVPIVAALIGIHAFQHGDGAMALIAAEHALAADPTYSFAQLIIDLTQSGIAPADAVLELQDASREALTHITA